MPVPHPPDDVVFRVTAQGGAGLTRQQTRRASLVAPSRGVRVVRGLADDPGARGQAAILGCRDGAVLSDLSAAQAWDLPLPPWLAFDRPRDSVAVPAGESHPQRAGIRGRRLVLPDAHLTRHAGLPITTPARTWLDCSALMPLEHVVAQGDVVLRRQLASRRELGDIVAWGRGRRGILTARRVLPMLDPGSESPGESITRAVLIQGRIPTPRCNANVYSGSSWLARVDLSWPAERVIVEYDGAVHLGEQQRRKDATRRNLLQDAGWMVIVFTAADLRHPDRMCSLVRSALRRGPRI